MTPFTLQPGERMIYDLRELYATHGYSLYKMNKFEEYDLYARNKDFLISDGVVTFTDAGGKLMALKPDVTLSIVKNTKDTPATVQKLCYNEHVYRSVKGFHGFKELMQVGLEAIGNVDDFCLFEVLWLAVKSLALISPDSILEISHLGLLSDALAYAGIPSEKKENVLHLISEKNVHEIKAVCSSLSLTPQKTDFLCGLASLYGSPEELMPQIHALLDDISDSEMLKRFDKVIEMLNSLPTKTKIRLDFSLVDDVRYYNGFVFKGYVQGVATAVLSGGQYDALMRRMNRTDGAVGFAVYLDRLEQLNAEQRSFDVDTLLVYDAQTSFNLIEKEAEARRQKGESVMVQPCVPAGLRYKTMVNYQNGQVIENA